MSDDAWKQVLPDLLPEFTVVDGKRVFSERTKAFMKIIDDGLPAGGDEPKRIAVIGAGMSGLVAASLLAGAGHRVSIFEANTRVGGRCKTITAPFSHGQFGEAGAMRLVDTYQLVFRYIERFGLATFPFINHDADKKELIFVNGVRVTRREYEADPDILGYPTVGHERGRTAQDLWAGGQGSEGALEPIQRIIDPTKGGAPTVENWARVIEEYGHYSVREYLKEVARYSEGAIEMIEVLLNLESRSNLSLIQQIVETVDHAPNAKYFGIEGGVERLPRAFVPELEARGVRFYFNHFLTAIDQRDPARVRIRFRGADTQAQNRPYYIGVPAEPRRTELETDAVVLTIPFPAMRYLEVEPAFSHQKRKAIRELNYNASTKIFLEFDNRFWETEDGIYGGQTTTDLASRFIYYPSTDFGGKNGGVVISSYTWASEARGWDSLTEKLRIEKSLDDVARIHGEKVRDHFVVGTSQSWLIDDFSMGEAAMLSPGQVQELEGTIPFPEDRVFFAGDATSFKIAWIEGAIEGGIRAALGAAGIKDPIIGP